MAETITGRIWWWDVTGPGQLAGGRTTFGAGGGNLLYGSPGYRLYDSMAVDSAGNVCQATLVDGGISVVSPDGEPVDFVAIPDDIFVTNICFGDPDLRTAYITVSGHGRLYSTMWPRPGAKLHFLDA